MVIHDGKTYKCATCYYWDREHAPCGRCFEHTWKNGVLVTDLTKWEINRSERQCAK